MKRVEVQAYGDAKHPDIGQTVVLLRGVRSLPGSTVFRLRPVDPADGEFEGEGQWPEGDHVAQGTRPCAEGTELIIGQDIGESPALLPGTAVEIIIPDARLRGEFLWPSIAPVARPRRRTLVARRIGRDAKPLAGETVRAAPRLAATPEAPAATPEPAPATASLGRPRQAPDVPLAAQPSPAAPPVAPAHVPLAGRPSSAPSDRVPVASTAPAASPRQGEPLMSAPSASPQSRTDVQPAAAALPDDTHGPEFVTWYPHARGGRIGGPSHPAKIAAGNRLSQYFPTSKAGILGLVVVAVVGIEGGLMALRNGQQPAASMKPAIARLNEGPATSGATPPAKLRLYDTLQVGAISPRGTASKESSPDKLIELASASLHATGAARDTEEGAFWLKRYIATILGDERTLRAFTQLGSVYADSSGRTPDYVKARYLWEVASAYG